mmetsp:Transcript_270/g.758  ORF Transcript_270/g.758 Transcript_270/m.758 type:complete len:486 (-) Transcript_270:147-1604(-)
MLTMRLSWVDPPVPDAGVRVPTRLAVFQNGFASLTPWNASPTLGEINSSFADSHRRVDEVLVIAYTAELLRLVEQLHSVGMLHTQLTAEHVLVHTLVNEDTEGVEDDGYTPMVRLELLGLSKVLDMRSYPQNTRFKVPPAHWRDARCVEQLDGSAWSFHADLFGLSSVVHLLLFNEPLQLDQCVTDLKKATAERERIEKYERRRSMAAAAEAAEAEGGGPNEEEEPEPPPPPPPPVEELLSEYERARREQMEKNRAMMESLGLLTAAKDIRDDDDEPVSRVKRGRPSNTDMAERRANDPHWVGEEEVDEGQALRKKARLLKSIAEDGTWKPHLPLKRYWQLELWQDFFSQVIHVHHELPCPELCNIRASFEAHLSQPSVRADLKAALLRQRSLLEARPSTSRVQLSRKIQADTLRRALGAVAADLGAAPADLEQTWCVPFDVVQETLVEVFGACEEIELLGALNKAVNTGKLANASGGYTMCPLY